VGDTGSNSGKTPTEFLGQLGSDLVAHPKVDADLAKILTGHILSVAPKPDCVASARKAIGELAKSRAAPQPKGS
jgi:hypothetical protein